MGDGPSVIRRPASRSQKSNTEFIHSLKANFSAARQYAADTAASSNEQQNTANGDSKTNGHIFPEWITREDSTLFIPTLDFTDSSLAEERSQYEITVKLFFLANTPASCRCAQTREAVQYVLKELHVPSIDLLIVSYPGISFDAEDEDPGTAAESTHESELSTDARVEDVDTMLETWGCLEELHDEGVIGRLGVSEFGTERLSKFLKKAKVRPSVDQINVRDCCVVPKPLIVYAKQEKVDLLTHSDSTNILPSGTLRELLGPVEDGAGILADATGRGGGLKGDVAPQWVIKYTAVVRDRGVIENKGYFASAELKNGR